MGARLAAHPRIRQIVFRNDTGSWNAEPGKYPDGVYLGIEYRSLARHDWKLDIWFIDEPDRQPDLRHLRAMPSQLSAETREAILLIKNRWAFRPEYGKAVSSFDIYQAVLAGRCANSRAIRGLARQPQNHFLTRRRPKACVRVA